MKRLKLSSAVRPLADYEADFRRRNSCLDRGQPCDRGDRSVTQRRSRIIGAESPSWIPRPHRAVPVRVRCWPDALTGGDEASRPAEAVAEQAHTAAGAQGAPRLLRSVRRNEMEDPTLVNRGPGWTASAADRDVSQVNERACWSAPKMSGTSRDAPLGDCQSGWLPPACTRRPQSGARDAAR